MDRLRFPEANDMEMLMRTEPERTSREGHARNATSLNVNAAKKQLKS
jgi:hypothetical protein